MLTALAGIKSPGAPTNPPPSQCQVNRQAVQLAVPMMKTASILNVRHAFAAAQKNHSYFKPDFCPA